MDKVVIDDKTFVPYITNDKIQARIKEVAAEIKKDCESKNPLFVCVLNGAFILPPTYSVRLISHRKSLSSDSSLIAERNRPVR